MRPQHTKNVKLNGQTERFNQNNNVEYKEYKGDYGSLGNENNNVEYTGQKNESVCNYLDKNEEIINQQCLVEKSHEVGCSNTVKKGREAITQQDSVANCNIIKSSNDAIYSGKPTLEYDNQSETNREAAERDMKTKITTSNYPEEEKCHDNTKNDCNKQLRGPATLYNDIANILPSFSNQHYSKQKRITINVSGCIFETYEATLNRFPESLLGNQNLRHEYYCQFTKQYYFNRNRKIFESILFFYQSNGKLYRPYNVNLLLFLDECRFFQLPQKTIDIVKEIECGFLTDKVNAARDLKGFTCSSQCQAAVWRFLEYPTSSKHAKIYFIAQMTFIIISIGLFSSESLTTSHDSLSHSLENPFLIAELIISIIFSMDFVARCLFCPNKKKHFLSVYTYIDLVCLVPYSMMTSTDDSELSTLGRLLKMVRFLRVLKMIRLSTRISQKLRILFVIINDSWRDLQIFGLGVLLIVFFSAAIVYVFEVNEKDTEFTSIPMSMWWSLQASITLGYGDIVPQTFMGRLISSIYMIYGLIWMMLPILALGLKVVVYGAEVREIKE